jgi:hypothetical protein
MKFEYVSREEAQAGIEEAVKVLNEAGGGLVWIELVPEKGYVMRFKHEVRDGLPPDEYYSLFHEYGPLVFHKPCRHSYLSGERLPLSERQSEVLYKFMLMECNYATYSQYGATSEINDLKTILCEVGNGSICIDFQPDKGYALQLKIKGRI